MQATFISDLVAALWPGENGAHHLHSMANHGHVNKMHVLMHLGVDVDEPDETRATALHVAVWGAQPGAVKLLVAAGADLEARDELGMTALGHACFAREDKTMAEILVDGGANVHSVFRTVHGRLTPAIVAMDTTSLMMRMLRRGSKPSEEIARMYAAHCRGSEKREKLLEILVKYEWAPPPSRAYSAKRRGGGATTADDSNKTAFSEKKPGASRDDFKNADEKGGLGQSFLLHAAVLRNDGGECLVSMLELGADPNALDASGGSPLHVAACVNEVAKLKALLNAGAVLGRKRSEDGLTALHVAAMHDHAEVAEALLAAAAARGHRKKPGGGSSAKSSSAGASSNQEAFPLSAVVEARDDIGLRPLHTASFFGSVQVVHVLLRAGARVDSRNKHGRTPLFYATVQEHTDVVAALLAAGASPSLRDSEGYAALHMAAMKPAGAVMEALIAGGASPGLGGERGFTPLHVACEVKARGTVEALLRAGAVPGHCWNDAMRSPLMVACMFENLGAVELLLPRLSARQINMRERVRGDGKGGHTPLVLALFSGGVDESETIGIVEALLKAGADPNLKTSTHLGPLEAAVVGPRTKISPTLGPPLVRALVAAGADVNGVCGDGIAPLHVACFNGACGEVVQALLDAGADACMPCASMWFKTPLQLAAAGGNVGAVSVLLGHPAYADVNTLGASPSRATVLASAVQNGKTEVCRLLLELGADMDLLTPSEELAGDGKTSDAASLIETAAQLGHLDVMRLLIQAKIFKDKAEEEQKGAGIMAGGQTTVC